MSDFLFKFSSNKKTMSEIDYLISLIVFYTLLLLFTITVCLIIKHKQSEAINPKKRIIFIIVCIALCLSRIIEFILHLSIRDVRIRLGVTFLFQIIGTMLFFIGFSCILYIWIKATRISLTQYGSKYFTIIFIVISTILGSLVIIFESMVYVTIITDVYLYSIRDAITLVCSIISFLISITFFVTTIKFVKGLSQMNWKKKRLIIISCILVVCFLTKSIFYLYDSLKHGINHIGSYYTVQYLIGEYVPVFSILICFLLDFLMISPSNSITPSPSFRNNNIVNMEIHS